jgi:hypothetical protein
MKRLLLLVVILVAIPARSTASAAGSYLDTAYVNGTVITMNGGNRVAEAVAVAQGKIVAVGSSVEIRALVSPNTRVQDLGGKVMLPEIISRQAPRRKRLA